jgi:hypothetical protein
LGQGIFHRKASSSSDAPKNPKGKLTADFMEWLMTGTLENEYLDKKFLEWEEKSGLSSYPTP